MPEPDARYAIGDLAALGDVSRRTVRYYVQEGLLPPPDGVGRGNHYGPAHLDALLRVKALQDAGHTLDQIRVDRATSGRVDAATRRATRTPSHPDPLLPRTLWRRTTLAPGVELHVEGGQGLPSTAALRELAEWCRRHLHDTRPSAEERE